MLGASVASVLAPISFVLHSFVRALRSEPPELEAKTVGKMGLKVLSRALAC